MKNPSRSKYAIHVLVSLLALWAVTACTAAPTPAISRETAIELATEDCKRPHLVLTGAPENIQAKHLSLSEAEALTRVGQETSPFYTPPDTRVWLVQMDGTLQIVGGPAPVPDRQGATPTPPPPFWGTCSVILDANSGKLMRVTGRAK